MVIAKDSSDMGLRYGAPIWGSNMGPRDGGIKVKV